MVGDERYVQHAMSRRYPAPRDRTLSSELLFVWLASERAWMTVRNVRTVDGQRIADSDARLDRLLPGSAPIDVSRLRRLNDESARFNLGGIGRNFNEPMLALRFLQTARQRRFKFTAGGNDTIDGVAARRLAFEEIERPTIIQDASGRSHESRGAIGIAVTYHRDAKLELLAPAVMHEIYMQTSATSDMIGPIVERIECEATYSNYRRFETVARIVPEP